MSSERPPLPPLPLVAGVASFLTLMVAAPGDVWLRDAGQLGAASWSLGVAHPTGFPLVMVAGRLASLLPLGSLAWRMGLVSAACAACAIGLAVSVALALLPRQVGWVARAVVAGAVAAVLLASPTWWLHATVLEVYAPTALVIAGGVRLLVAHVEAPSRRTAALLGLLAGLSVGVHVTGPLCLAVVWVALLAGRPPREAGRVLLVAVPLALAGTLVLAYLPAAAAHDPWRNWGDPSTLARIIDHATGASIRAAFAGTIGSTHPLVLEANLLSYGEQLADGVGAALVLAAVGAVWLVVAGRRAVLGALLGIWLVDAAFTVLVNPMGIVDRQTGVPSLVVAAVLAGVGVGAVVRGAWRLVPRVREALPALLAGASVVAALWWAEVPEGLRPQPGWAELWGRAALAQVPPGGLVATATDDTSGVLTFLLGVEGARPDVAHLELAHLYDPGAIGHWRRLYGAVVPDEALDLARSADLRSTEVQRGVLGAIVAEAERRGTPVLWEPSERDLDVVVEPRLRGAWPLWPLVRDGDKLPYPVTDAQSAPLRWEALATPDAAARRLLALTARSAALIEVGRGRPVLATALLAGAATQAPDEPKVLSNLLTLRARAGALDEALSLARHLVRVAPAYAAGRLDLAGLLVATGSPDEAEEHAEAGLSLAAGSRQRARALVLLGRVALARGDATEAARNARLALEAAPGSEEAEALLREAR
ncbi:MAG: hypothetical protein AMXMBFR64_61260 [Myxococcales bacterium]